MVYNKNSDEIGALWIKKSSSGNEFMSGNIEIEGKQIKIVCFYNDKKLSDKQPDWKILISRPRTEQKEQFGYTDTTQKTNEALDNASTTEEDIDISEIPF